jgi:hypothetical protein
MRNIFLFKSDGDGMDLGSDTNRALFRQDLKEHVGKTYRIERVIPVRSMPQNALYWAYLGIVEQETGNNANDLHELFKRTLLPPKFITVMGKEIKIPKSTTQLTKIEFGDYLDKISAECGVPLPNKEDLEAMGYISN